MYSPKRRSGSFKPGPRPSYMTQDEMTEYLHNLRNNKPIRPSTDPDSDPRASVSSLKSNTDSGSGRTSSHLSHRQSSDRISPTRSPEKRSSFIYRDHDPQQTDASEARHIRMAMDQIGFEHKDDADQRLYAAAQQEASELIRRHRDPKAPYAVAMPPPPPNSSTPAQGTRSSLSVNRLRSQKSDVIARNQASLDSELISPDLPNIKKQSSYSKLANYWNNSGLGQRRRSSGSRRSLSGKHKGIFVNPEDKIYEDPSDRMRSPQKAEAPWSGKPPTSQSSTSRRNPFARAGSVADRSMAADPTPVHKQQGQFSEDLGREESSIQSQHGGEVQIEVRYKDGMEVRSDEIRAATGPRYKDRSQKLPSPSAVSNDPTRPIVSFQPDWVPNEQQAALLYSQHPAFSQPQARTPSPKDPTTPSFVFPPPRSTSPHSTPQIHISPVQSHESGERTIPNTTVPCITVGMDDTSEPPRRSKSRNGQPLQQPVIPNIAVTSPLPEGRDDKPRRGEQKPSKPYYSAFPPAQRPPPSFSQQDMSSRPHITPTRRATALCAQCALPIAGRIVSAAGLRFHPNCFTCFHCGEGLECVDFYPEPGEKREVRLDRIQRRMDGEHIEDLPGATEAEDGDDSLRFYCHLDFHELFSPRCKSCKTPIEGEVVVACGAEWHVGHFFCAQCGDPFDQSTPFVEKDGYAWCVECHTNRYSAKCKKCRRPVTNTVIQALGAEWHSECFCCTQCGGDFDGGRFFLRHGTQDPVCLACEQKRLKA